MLKSRIPLTPLGTAQSRLFAASTSLHYTLAVAPKLRGFNLGEEAAYLAWEIVRCVPSLLPEEERALFFLVLASVVNLHEGSTRLPVSGSMLIHLEGLLERLGDASVLPLIQRLLGDQRLDVILGRPGEYKPLILDGDYLYHQRTLYSENHLGNALGRRLRQAPFPVDLVAAQQALDQISGTRLSAEQRLAVLTAVCSPLTVITGGPGTGKTSIVVAILQLLIRLGVPANAIALAAPTGKAAYRMKASIHAGLSTALDSGLPDGKVVQIPDPRTLHRLLGYSPNRDRFRFHAQNQLLEKVIIIDECSMIDLYMMDRLIHAVQEEARLVLLGDAEQLPSVEAGSVFRNLVPSGSGSGASPWRALIHPERHGVLPPPAISDDPRWKAAVRLTHSYRMDASRPEGRHILVVAERINRGAERALFSGEGGEEEPIHFCSTPKHLSFRGVEMLEDLERPSVFLDLWLERHVTNLEGWSELVTRPIFLQEEGIHRGELPGLRRLFDHYESSKILCLTRTEVGGIGADAVNTYLHTSLGRKLGLPTENLCPGVPVMMLQNDYHRELFNGDQGIVLRVRDKEGVWLAVIFRRGVDSYTIFPLDTLQTQVQLAFAMTVHKSQGSEFEHIALILPGLNLPLLTREVLYTAVTRSKTSVVIVGQRMLLEAGIRQPIERFSGLAERFHAAPEESMLRGNAP